MIRQLLALLCLSFLVSCSTSKPHIKTTKNDTHTTRKRATRKTRKPARMKVDTKTETASATSKERQTETLEATSKTVVYAEVVNDYIQQYKGVAEDNMRRHGIPASITLAQGILESGAGRGTLCVTANNHFGIKCHNDWTGDTVRHDDDAEQECFRKYKDPSESFNDHSLFLTTRGRYASLFKLDKDDYSGWAHGLKAAGYATDPKYPAKLIGIIERYNLAQLDAEVLGRKQKVMPKQDSTPKQEIAAPKAQSQQVADAAVPSGSYKVMQGDTLYSISKKHNITVDELMRLNGLAGNAISIGQVLKVK